MSHYSYTLVIWKVRHLLKKNQLVLILLTLVLMLTIYYIKSPFGKNNENGDNPGDETDTTEVLGRLEELQKLRVALNEERTQTVLGLDSIIADNNSTIAQKNAALEEKRYLNNLTEKELLLEIQIINKGYRDAFVHASDQGVTITVVANEHSIKAANEIIVMAMTGFDKVFDNVSVQFSTVEEVMGKVA